MKKHLFSITLLISILSIAFTELHAIDNDELRTKYITGVQSLAQNDLDKSETLFKEIIALTSKDASPKALQRYQSKAYYFLGDVYFIRKDYNKSISYYRAVVEKFNVQDIYSRALYKLGRTLAISKQYTDAIAILSDYITRYDNKDSLGDNTLYWIGRCYIGQKDMSMALTTFQLILAKYPSTSLAYDIRSTMKKLRKLISLETQKTTVVKKEESGLNEKIAALKETNERLKQQRELLEKINDMLKIKQRLLEIKSSKVELLGQLRQKRSSK